MSVRKRWIFSSFSALSSKDSPVIVKPPTNSPMSLPPTMMLSLRSPLSLTPEFLFFQAAQIPTNRIRR